MCICVYTLDLSWVRTRPCTHICFLCFYMFLFIGIMLCMLIGIMLCMLSTPSVAFGGTPSTMHTDTRYACVLTVYNLLSDAALLYQPDPAATFIMSRLSVMTFGFKGRCVRIIAYEQISTKGRANSHHCHQSTSKAHRTILCQPHIVELCCLWGKECSNRVVSGQNTNHEPHNQMPPELANHILLVKRPPR